MYYHKKCHYSPLGKTQGEKNIGRDCIHSVESSNSINE